MKEKVKVLYRMYYDFPLQVKEHTVGAKMIDTQRISGLTLFSHTADNLKKGNECNQKLKQIKKLHEEISAIEKSMEQYTD